MEILVALLEADMGRGEGARVESPAFLLDRDTGERREVDVAVHVQSGTHQLLVVMECRERKSPADVTWIEQVHTKCRSVGADRLVAVSASGFTKPALDKAQRLNIETRTLKDFEPKADAERLFSLSWVNHHPSIFNVRIRCVGGSLAQQDWPHPVPPRDPLAGDDIFLQADTGRRFSIRQLFASPGILDRIVKGLVPGKVEPVHMEFKQGRVATDQGGSIQWVKGLEADLRLKEDQVRLEPTRERRYARGDAPLAHVAEFNLSKDVRLVATAWPKRPEGSREGTP